MTNTQSIQTIVPTVAVEEWVGPCGCPACDKWADCDYCHTCTPEEEIQRMLDWQEQMAQEQERMEEDAMPLWVFMYGEE